MTAWALAGRVALPQISGAMGASGNLGRTSPSITLSSTGDPVAGTEYSVTVTATDLAGALVVTPANVTGTATFNPTTVTPTPGELVKLFGATWAAAGAASIRATAANGVVSNTLSLTVAPAPSPPSPGSEYSDPDWLTRKSGASVIAAHAFDYDAEVSQHLVGSTDPTDHPVPVRRVVDEAGFGCLEQVVIGAELAAAYTAGGTTMVINDAYLWPDPAVTGSFYFMVAKAYPSAPDKNVFLCTARSGTTLTVAYQSGYGSAFASTAQNYSIGDYAGNENSREWRRTFAALPAGENGLPTDDPAASGAVPLRSKSSSGTYGVPRDASYWQYGWYGHPSNQTTWASWTPWIGTTTYTPRGTVNGAAAKYRLWDGDTIHIQFRMKISRRFAQYHQQPASTESYWVRKTFALQSEVSSTNQLVVDVGPPNTYYLPDTPQFPFKLGSYKDSRTIGVDDWARSHVSYQPGSGWDVAPYYANLNTGGLPSVGAPTPDGSAAWKIPDDEWVTFYMRVKPGRSNVAETEIDVKFARQDQAGYTGAYTTLLSVTDALIIYSGSGDVEFPDGAFTYPTVTRMDALPGYQAFGLMGYLNLFQAAGWVPPRASYSIRMSQVIFSQAAIPAPAAAALPSWLSSATARTWVSVPQATTLASLDVTGNSSITPTGADWVGSGLSAGLFSWSTHRWDDINRKFSIGPAGGHTDYGGNDVARVVVDASADWQRTRLPSGALPGPSLTGNDGQESTGLYSDGRQRAQHTYHNHRFIPGYGEVIVRSTAHFRAGTGDVKKAWTVDSETGESLLRCDFSAITLQGNGEGSFDYDSKRNCLWHVGSAASKWVKFTNLSARTWTATDQSSAPGLPRDNYLPPSGAIRYVRSADRIATFPSYTGLGTGRLGVMNPNTLTFITPTVTGSFSTGFMAPDMSANQPGCGFEWCEALGCFLLWNNTSSLAEISTLTPSNPSDWSQPWTRGVLTVSGANTTNPGVAPNSGVFGRAMYSAALNAVLVHVTTSSPIMAFKL